MLQALLDSLRNIPKEWAVVIVAALPVFELRGAIPLAMGMGFSASRALGLSLAGNFIPILPVLFFLEPVSNALGRFPPWKRFLGRCFERTRAKSELIQKYEALGLMLFVAVPLPMTGVWTGCIAASLFRIKFRYAFPALVSGMVIAGLLVTAVCAIGKDSLIKYPVAALVLMCALALVFILFRLIRKNRKGHS